MHSLLSCLLMKEAQAIVDSYILYHIVGIE